MIVGLLCIKQGNDTYVHAMMIFDNRGHIDVANELRVNTGIPGEWVSAITLEPGLPILVDRFPFKLGD